MPEAPDPVPSSQSPLNICSFLHRPSPAPGENVLECSFSMALFFDTFPAEVVSTFPPLNSGWVLTPCCPGEFGGSGTLGLSRWMRTGPAAPTWFSQNAISGRSQAKCERPPCWRDSVGAQRAHQSSKPGVAPSCHVSEHLGAQSQACSTSQYLTSVIGTCPATPFQSPDPHDDEQSNSCLRIIHYVVLGLFHLFLQKQT